MAKNTPKGQGRIRVFFAELEGDDETVQEGLRAIGAAVSKTFQPRVIKVLPPAAEQPRLMAGVSDDDSAVEEFGEMPENGEADDVSVTTKPQSKGKRKPPTMMLVKDLDLRPDGKEGWRDFFSEKQPKSQQEQIAVAVYYLRLILEADNVTPHHVYTCLKDVDQRTPNDLPQIIRNTANRKGWVDTANAEAIQITNRGQNFVEHDLPHKGGD